MSVSHGTDDEADVDVLVSLSQGSSDHGGDVGRGTGEFDP